jgi:phosphoribosylanthranilate isomerase
MTRVKICGITNNTDLQMVQKIGADALGFIVEIPRAAKRNLDRNQARELIKQLSVFTKAVLVIEPQDLKTGFELIKTIKPEIIQLHGKLSLDEIRAMKSKSKAKIVIPYGITQKTTYKRAVEMIEKYIRVNVDAILLDSKGVNGVGGTGKTHNWEFSAELVSSFDIPMILAGGLTEKNVAEAIQIVEPYAVDVSSGVEREPGRKDYQKVETLIKIVRNET